VNKNKYYIMIIHLELVHFCSQVYYYFEIYLHTSISMPGWLSLYYNLLQNLKCLKELFNMEQVRPYWSLCW